MTIGKCDFLDDMQYIDGITIIDTSGKILFSVKFNPVFQSDKENVDGIIGKKLYEIFTNIDAKSSTLIKAMELGLPIYNKKQSVVDVFGSKIYTKNVSVPIKANGRIIGAIEISKDINKYQGSNGDTVEMNLDMFRNQKPMDERLYSDKAKYTLDDIVSGNRSVQELKEFVKRIADSSAPVFIYGESGHDHSYSASQREKGRYPDPDEFLHQQIQ